MAQRQNPHFHVQGLHGSLHECYLASYWIFHSRTRPMLYVAYPRFDWLDLTSALADLALGVPLVR
jgi:hypothetical protein